jgi:hypothetical protein
MMSAVRVFRCRHSLVIVRMLPTMALLTSQFMGLARAVSVDDAAPAVINGSFP